MNRTSLFAGLGSVVVVAVVALVLLPGQMDVSETDTFDAPGLEPMTIEEARTEFWRLTPALFLVVYDAFGLTQEDAIYDTLASVTHGDALEYLYLERVGAMAGGGLEEADQTIHEIKLLNTSVARDGADLAIDASWQVIGTVGHAEHLHVRGNTYSADLLVSPVEGGWRITDFELLEVNRDAAGETFLAPPNQLMITVENLSFRYSATSFRLRVPAFDLRENERVAIVGPSGSGKTTLLNLIAGILTPEAGRIDAAGTDVATLSDVQRRRFRASTIGFVFQDLPCLTTCLRGRTFSTPTGSHRP